jgi:Short C-terminal domain/Phospholipase_D-nuclease N-terminal
LLPLAAYDLGDLLWSMLVFFAWIIFFWLLFIVFGDLFRRHDISGWGKAGWTIFVILLPFLGVLIYLIANGQGMAERSAKDVQTAQAQTDAYIKSVAGSGAPADQIARAKELLDSGAISQAEFDQLKAKALASA